MLSRVGVDVVATILKQAATSVLNLLKMLANVESSLARPKQRRLQFQLLVVKLNIWCGV
jgi:hypothetical protein